MAKKRLGERLLEDGLVKEDQLAQALLAQQSTGEQLGSLLVRLGYLGENDLLRVLCHDADIEFRDLADLDVEPALAVLVPESLARAHQALPLGADGGRLRVALADPFDVSAASALERATGQRISIVGAPRERVLSGIEQLYSGEGGGAQEVRGLEHRPPAPGEDGIQRDTGLMPDPDPERFDTSGTAAQTAEEIFQRGVVLGATDIHVEPIEDAVRVRYRIDGVLREGPTYPRSMQAPLLTRIKVIASLNIAESRLPQDGRLRLNTGGRNIDLRVSTFPTLYGEDVVLRVLDRSRVSLRLDRLGMEPDDLGLFRELLARPHGIILITGPTGSGKTTTLYSALAELNTGEKCILTIEDPVEYELAGVRQSQINPRAGLTFATGLRSMLRHDPDVILVGEIRDRDTAQIALSAAMTGHLVLSTLHTNTAAAAIPRLLDMDVEAFALASSLQLSVAQRLLRLLCEKCKTPVEVPPAVRRRFNLGETTVYAAQGCTACNGTGYKGRIAVFELLPISDEVGQAIHDGRGAEEIQRSSKRDPLLEAGLKKVRAGLTSLEELLRVVTL